MSSLYNTISFISSLINRTEYTANELQNILFLIDWRAALSSKPSISNLEWEIGLDGPYSKSLFDQLKPNRNNYSITGEVISFTKVESTIESSNKLEKWEKNIINFTIAKILKLNKQEFENLIKSIFPMKLEKYSHVDLQSIAKNYLDSGVIIQKLELEG